MITDRDARTRIDEIADGIYRISTPIAMIPGGFTFNQYLLVDERPLLFHTGPRRMFPLVRGAIEALLPVERLGYVSFSHYEADECGSLNDFLAAAPAAVPLCGKLAAMISIADVADRTPKAMEDGETVSLGVHKLRWCPTPHLPHGWECGYLFEETTRTLLCGDLLTQGGAEHAPLVETDILEPAEAMRANMDYYAHTPNSAALLNGLAALAPATLACMHGSAWRGDGAKLLKELGRRIAA
jgi:flavorubredoxin